jgi:3-oxoacyl-[acyl-carrier-protein] synthase II
MSIYINGIGNISAQKTWENSSFLEEIVEFDSNHLTCHEPNFKDYISPVRLRRMSRVIKIGLTSSFIALKDAGVESPGAIITGTGFGCVGDTEKFMFAVIENKETQLPPTAFMQSTHNTISGQIAINLKCKNYNSTYVHRGASFIRAMEDAIMLLKEKNAENVLVGGFDECTPEHYTVMGRVGRWKDIPVKNTELLKHSESTGSIAGEGAQFFVVSEEKTNNCYAKITDIESFYKPESNQEIENRITKFLERNSLSFTDIDAVVLGKNGDVNGDECYNYLTNGVLKDTQQVYFKHLSGQYDSCDSFAMWLAAKSIYHQQLPAITKLNDKPTGEIKNVLIYNHFLNKYHGLQLLSGC